MLKYVWSHLDRDRGRSAVVVVGILVASTCFTLLTAATTTSRLQLGGTVDENFRGAYDILVRPQGAATQVEQELGLVRTNYLAGSFGGITREQYEGIRDADGVDIAAPIANIGYVLPAVNLEIPVTELPDEGAGLYRLTPEWSAHGGASSYPEATLYVYYTDRDLVEGDGGNRELGSGELLERLPDGRMVPVCGPFTFNADGRARTTPTSPFDRSGESLTCFSARSAGPDRFVGGTVRFAPPILLAAVDPDQEQRLVDLDQTLVEGRYLDERDGAPFVPLEQVFGREAQARRVPVITSNQPTGDTSLTVVVERLEVPAGVDLPLALADRGEVRELLPALDGSVVDERVISTEQAYSELVARFTGAFDLGNLLGAYWVPGDVRYERAGVDGPVMAMTSQPTTAIWQLPTWPENGFPAPPGNEDVQFRALELRPGSDKIDVGEDDDPDLLRTVGLEVVGRFDTDLLPGFSELSAVPLETYYPPVARPADEVSREALGGQPLRPSTNIGDYLQQPPLMLTTLDAAEALLDPRAYEGADPEAPISSVRVRVEGVTGADAVSRERIRRVAEAITEQTGLVVDFTAGSSPTQVTVRLPEGEYGRPALTLDEPWVRKGAALTILRGTDEKSVVLLALVLVVCALFVANAALAAVRTRRAEIGVLRALGWTPRSVFIATLGEVAVLGLAAGVLGSGLAAGLVTALELDFPLVRTLAIPVVAVGLAVAAGTLPAGLAARAQPLDALRGSAREPRRERPTKTVNRMALANLRRQPARAVLGGAGLAIAVACMTVLLAVNAAFAGLLDETLLGESLVVNVRPVDYASVLLAALLGAVSVADVTYLNLRDRANEFLTLRTTGWTRRPLLQLAWVEAASLAVLAALTGSGVGLGVLAALSGRPPGGQVLTSLLVACGAAALAGLAVLPPLRRIANLPPPSTLAQE
ncbi:MAG: ABC transporter permease [Solirubrobacterales bacterium]|nr:ABC transporter permease [Solirubrobacterales bacterium]